MTMMTGVRAFWLGDGTQVASGLRAFLRRGGTGSQQQAGREHQDSADRVHGLIVRDQAR
jgi:hypothetical protein